MSKKEIVDKILKNKDTLGIKHKGQAEMIFDSFMNILKEKLQALEEGEYFRLHKVGRFYSVSIKEKKIRDLRSDEMIVVPPSRRIRFKAFLNSLNFNIT